MREKTEEKRHILKENREEERDIERKRRGRKRDTERKKGGRKRDIERKEKEIFCFCAETIETVVGFFLYIRNKRTIRRIQ